MITNTDLQNWFTYHSPTGKQPSRYQAIREAGLHLAKTIVDNSEPSADQTAAVRKVREAVMTANQAIACEVPPGEATLKNAVRNESGKRKLMVSEQTIAMVCHEANRAYCSTIGDLNQPTWAEAPDWQKESAVEGVRFHLGVLRTGSFPTPSESHEKWLALKRQEGWKYGPVKDPEKKEHPCFLPYDELPVEQRMKDYLFAAIVHTFWVGEMMTLKVVSA
jgi:RyR domain